MMADTPIEISATEVGGLLDQPGERRFRLIDCREESEWQICRLPAAVFVPLSRFSELIPQVFADPQEHLIIYCHHGMRSHRAAQWLRECGFARAQSMCGGIDCWADLIDPAMSRY